MSSLLLVAEHRGRRYEIIHDDLVGYYVFAYASLGPPPTHDYLQPEFDSAKECAKEEFGVPFHAWRPAGNDEMPAYEA